MKDRVREALFNLVGPDVKGTRAIDLFAGTGALGFEALSRGAARATFIERHFPTAALIRRNAATLGVGELSEIVTSDTFLWARRMPDWDDVPWVVFSSPPYDFYVERTEDMLLLLTRLIDRAPAQSVFVVESDERFDPTLLPPAGQWDVRQYPPAVVAIYRKASG
jgi:16S rRNA (guanine966-N2)-methyltransferase